jgi:hypothetical protein
MAKDTKKPNEPAPGPKSSAPAATQPKPADLEKLEVNKPSEEATLPQTSGPAGDNTRTLLAEPEPEPATVTLDPNGPTFEEWVRASYPPDKYPPAGYAEVSSPGLAAFRATGALPAPADDDDLGLLLEPDDEIVTVEVPQPEFTTVTATRTDTVRIGTEFYAFVKGKQLSVPTVILPHLQRTGLAG